MLTKSPSAGFRSKSNILLRTGFHITLLRVSLSPMLAPAVPAPTSLRPHEDDVHDFDLEACLKDILQIYQ
eukprot:4518295-Amphidinium_carterae.1